MSNAKVNFDLPTGIENLDATVQYTTPPYPVEVVEAVTSEAGLDGLRFMSSNIEAVGPTADLTAIELRPILQSTTVEDEAVQPTADLTGIELDTVLVETTVEDEAVQPTADLTGILLESKLIENDMNDEAVQPTANITGIELS